MRLFLIAAAGAALLAVAQPAEAAPSARSLELARRYVAALHMEDTMGVMMANMAPSVLDSVARTRQVAVTSELKAAFSKAAEDSMRAMTPKMVEVMIPIVAETFTEAELEAAVVYYESPLAQSLLRKSGTFTERTTPALQRLMPEMQQDLAERFCRDVGCDAASPP